MLLTSVVKNATSWRMLDMDLYDKEDHFLLLELCTWKLPANVITIKMNAQASQHSFNALKFSLVQNRHARALSFSIIYYSSARLLNLPQ